MSAGRSTTHRRRRAAKLKRKAVKKRAEQNAAIKKHNISMWRAYWTGLTMRPFIELIEELR